MVVAALAIEAAAAFVAAQSFNLAAAAALSAAAGFAWGTAKFGFDGLLQATVPAEGRGRAFTGSETFFQFAWVVGALIPIVPGSKVGFFSLPALPVEAGLIAAGLTALAIQVIYVSARARACRRKSGASRRRWPGQEARGCHGPARLIADFGVPGTHPIGKAVDLRVREPHLDRSTTVCVLLG